MTNPDTTTMRAISQDALTAYQALVDTADVRAGQRVLIHAAAGTVGHLAVPIAKSRGAYVIGTASAANRDFLRSLASRAGDAACQRCCPAPSSARAF